MHNNPIYLPLGTHVIARFDFYHCIFLIELNTFSARRGKAESKPGAYPLKIV